MPPPFAHIALGLNFNKILTYAIPPELADSIAVGKRVLVPLRRLTQVGFVVELADSSEFADTKDILDVLDSAPVIPQDLLSFTRWAADYYLCPWGEVLEAALPAGVNPKVELWARINPNTAAATEGRGVVPPRGDYAPTGLPQKILQALQIQSPQKVSSLRRQLGSRSLMDCLRKLEQGGEIILEEKVKKTPRRESGERWVRLAGPLFLEQEIGKKKRAPKQAALLKSLQSGPLKAAAAAISASALKALLEEGIVEYFYQSPLDLYPEYPPPQSLTPEQNAALSSINQAVNERKFTPFLLHGVTGSGKTEVYLNAMQTALEQGRSVLYLVPEIALTHQLIGRLEGRLKLKCALWHSRLTAAQRYLSWKSILDGQSRVVLGARSAIFAPLKDLGLIIVDEEHDEAYKQEESPRYNARDLALVRGRDSLAAVILGSATPSLESYYNTQKGKYTLLTLSERVEDRPLPAVTLWDRRGEEPEEKKSPFSWHLLAKAKEKIAQGEQVLFFLNRRGYAPYVLCLDCGKSLPCPFCDLSLTYHLRGKSLICHHCGYKTFAPEHCPHCRSYKLKPYGAGTQKLEEELAKYFPGTLAARLDRDAAEKKGHSERIWRDWESRNLELLVGTKMIAKGHDYPGVTLVGVMNADAALNMPDFRAAERAFQLLTQVAGRAGRGDSPGEVILQTYNSDHYSLKAAKEHDYPGFYRQELARRQEHEYPPFYRLARLIFSGPNEEAVAQSARQAKVVFMKLKITGLIIEGPSPAPYTRLRGKYRWHLILKHKEVKDLHQALALGLEPLGKGSKNVGLAVDVDPVGVL